MAELFGVEVPTINYHLKEVYNSGELTEEATIRKIRIVQQEGKRNVERELDFYHLKAILAVGDRVNSNNFELVTFTDVISSFCLFVTKKHTCKNQHCAQQKPKGNLFM